MKGFLIIGMLLAASTIGFGVVLRTTPIAEATTLPNVHAEPSDQVCSLKTVCKPLHPKPRAKVSSHPRPVRLDLMCYEVILILNPIESIPLALTLPPDIMPPDVDDTPEPEPTVPPATPAVYTVYGNPGGEGGAIGGWGWTGDAPKPIPAHYGNPGRVSAPEIDPCNTLGALTLLCGSLAVLRGKVR